MMTPETQDRYYGGGDIYAQFEAQYGFDAANAIADAAATGDPAQVNAALVKVKFGNNLPTDTFNMFLHQITTDPLAAPIGALDGQLQKVVMNLIKNPLVLVALAAGVFFMFGGADLIRRKIKG